MHGHVDETELQLRVPARAQLSLDAVSAAISVTDTSGSIDAKSVSGDVQLVVGSGEIKASPVSGDLSVKAPRPEERRVGKGCGSSCRSRWSPDHEKQQNKR